MAASTEVDGRLWLLQERLKQEHLFVTKEKESIQQMSKEIQSTFEKLFHLSWIAGQQWRNLHRLQAHPAKASYANSLLDNAQFVDAYKGFGHLESKYGEFLRGLRERPQLLASSLAFVDSIKINMDIRQFVRLVLNSLYGNCLLPEDENYVLMMMKSLMECQVLESEQPSTFFRSPKNWSFTVMFGVLIESLFSAKLYLTAALHTPILHVLAKDSLIQAQLPFLCTRFVQNLEEKLYCFPPSLRWLVCQLFNVLRSSVISEKQAKSMVSELIFNYLICPAIINPEPYGINSDMQVSKTARLNLQQISSLLCKSCTAPWQDDQVFQTADMFNSIDVKSISSFVDSILDGAHQMNDFPDQQTLPGLCRTSVLITENELKALIAFMKMVCSWEGDIEFTQQNELQELLDLLPEEIETLPKQIQTPNIPTPSPSASPKVSHKGRKLPWKKHGKHLSDAHSLDDDEEQTLKKTTTTLLTSVTPTVPKAEKYQQECIKRLGELFQENEDVLVVSLGYSSVESPGMLSEEQVLDIEKPKIKQAKKPRNNSDGTQPFRARTSSNKFTKLFHEMSIEKDLNKNGSSSSENEVETSGDHRLDTIVGSPSVSKVDEAEEVAVMIKMHEQQKVDLVQGTTVASLNPFKSDGPDVVESGTQNSEGGNQPAEDLLIDFSSEPAHFSPVTSSNNANHHTGSLLDAPLSSDHLPHIPGLPELAHSTSTVSPRDSTISSGSSARDSTLSNWSGLSSGRESTVDSGFVEIREEDDDQFNRYSHGTNPFNRYSLGDTSPDDRRSVISTVSRDSYSSGTLIEGVEGFYRSNRDSQVSTWSEDYHGDVQRSGSSSTEDDDLDLRDQPKTKKLSKASIKKKIEKKAQSLNFNDRKKNKDREKRRKSLLESDSSSKNEKKGFMKRWRDKGQKKLSKQSGARVYQPIDDKTMSMFTVLPTIPFVQVEAADEKTPKDIMDKYIKVAARKQVEDFSEGKGEEEESEGEDDDVLDEADRLEDTKRKLRIVFTQADFRNLPWLVSKDRVNTSSPLEGDGGELMTFLHVQLAEAINLQNRALAAQLHETIRSVKQLSQGSCSNILSLMEKEYQERMPYVAYLTRSRQALLTTQCHMESLIERVQKNEMICKKCFSTNCITLFLEEREREINSFINGFRSTDVCPTVDEKCKYLEQFLEKMYAELEKDEAWLGTTEKQFEEGCIAIERDIMARVYNDAFYPNGEADMERDKAFTKHVERLQGIVGVNHRAIRIPKMYRKEAPWPSAQQELKTINAYKTPKDKLKCVQRCCFTIMNLLNMASASNSCDPAGADEFVPALVCVLIQANPPSLLSTMQYVSNFYEQRLRGEEAWSWMQLCAAIEYTKTIQG